MEAPGERHVLHDWDTFLSRDLDDAAREHVFRFRENHWKRRLVLLVIERDRHLRRMRQRYRRRRDVLVGALARHIPEIEIRGVAAGLHVVAVLPTGLDERRVLREARARGLALSGLSEHAVRTPREQALLLGYAVSREPTIEASVTELAKAVRAVSA